VVVSAIPAAKAAIVALASAALPAWQVVNGPVWDPLNMFLAVGWDRTDQPAVQFSFGYNNAAGASGIETAEISCLLSLAYDATEDQMTAVESTLFDAYRAVADAIMADPLLGGVVMTACPSDGDVIPFMTIEGPVVDLRFSVRVQA
jgi:hypothetical protein